MPITRRFEVIGEDVGDMNRNYYRNSASSQRYRPFPMPAEGSSQEVSRIHNAEAFEIGSETYSNGTLLDDSEDIHTADSIKLLKDGTLRLEFHFTLALPNSGTINEPWLVIREKTDGVDDGTSLENFSLSDESGGNWQVVAAIVRDLDAGTTILPTLRNDITGTSVAWGSVEVPFYRFDAALTQRTALEYTP